MTKEFTTVLVIFGPRSRSWEDDKMQDDGISKLEARGYIYMRIRPTVGTYLGCRMGTNVLNDERRWMVFEGRERGFMLPLLLHESESADLTE